MGKPSLAAGGGAPVPQRDSSSLLELLSDWYWEQDAEFRFTVVSRRSPEKPGADPLRGADPGRRHGPGFPVHTDIIVPYITSLGTDEQKQRWLPGCVSGETHHRDRDDRAGRRQRPAGHPHDRRRQGRPLRAQRLQDLHQQRHHVRPGDRGRAAPTPSAGHKGISLLVVERGMEGFERGRNLDKIGLHAQDTAELFFDNVEVPKENLLGEEGSGFIYLMMNLPQERLSIAAMAVAAVRGACSSCASTTPRSARRSASRSASSSTTGSCSPRWPPRPTSRGSSSTTA